jgi:hypothetical protein
VRKLQGKAKLAGIGDPTCVRCTQGRCVHISKRTNAVTQPHHLRDSQGARKLFVACEQVLQAAYSSRLRGGTRVAAHSAGMVLRLTDRPGCEVAADPLHIFIMAIFNHTLSKRTHTQLKVI